LNPFADVSSSDTEACDSVYSVHEQKDRFHSERHWQHEETEPISETARSVTWS